MSTLKQVLSCFGSQGREEHFQGGVHLSHLRIASLGYNAITWHYLTWHYLTISNSSYQFGTGAFYLNYYYFRHLRLGCGHLLVHPHRVAPSLMAQSWYLPAPVESLDLALLQAWSPKELKPGSQLQNLTPTDCYTITIDAIQKSRVTVIFHVYQKKKIRMFWNSVEWPFDQRLNTLTHQISVIKARGFRCGV